MKKLLSVAALLLLASGAQAASQSYILNSITYFNTFAPAPINVANCIACGTGLAVDDGFGNISLTGIAWSFNAGGNNYNISFDATTTLAAGTSLDKLAAPAPTCNNVAGTVCTVSNVISGLGGMSFLTGIGSDNATACINDRCRVDVSIVGLNNDLQVRIRRALSESISSTASQTLTLTFAAVPVPAGVWLIGSALAALGFARRKAG